MFIEPLTTKNIASGLDISCTVATPYQHSVYMPTYQPQVRSFPWSFPRRRTALLGKKFIRYSVSTVLKTDFSSCFPLFLAFYGGVRHYNSRLDALRSMDNYAQNHKSQHPLGMKDLFITSDYSFRGQSDVKLRAEGYHPEGLNLDVLDKAHLVRGWEMYAISIFSWHPHGDTPTRRAFYDSWMFGCIPVISKSCSFDYEQIFHGMLFTDTPLSEIAVYVDDEIMFDGPKLLQHLSSISSDEVNKRRAKLALLAPRLQWGYRGSEDSLRIFFASMMTKYSSLGEANTAEFEGKFLTDRFSACKYMAEKYSIRVNVEWGSTPEELKPLWDSNNCNSLFSEGPFRNNNSDGMNSPEYYEHFVSTAAQVAASAKSSAIAINEVTVQKMFAQDASLGCKWLHSTYHVDVGHNWGELPAELITVWKANYCHEKLAV
jgi:hypothetical protein